MTPLDWLRKLLSGSPHVDETVDDSGEVEAALSGDFATTPPSDASLERMARTGQTLRASEAAEAAVDDLESMEAPPDRDP